mmetsp:Transcript_17379/g.44073  ORF Transcript_17379/g.44073 Transcript_17379/m.44073 type:complete len:237 (-) Transcript_17379:460-1170(-)
MLCVSVAERSLEDCLRVLDALGEDEMAEVRVDLISSRAAPPTAGQAPGLDDDALAKVWAHPRRKIATCRDLATPGFTDERRQVLEAAMATGTVQLVDLEFEAPQEYREAIAASAKAHGVELIVSYHNYDETPSDEELRRIVDTCFEYGADIAKVAVQAKTTRDSARVLALYSDERKVVALAMGGPGMISRVAATSLGAPFTFVAQTPEKATAPGQLTLDQMRTIGATMAGPAGSSS